MEVDSGLSQRTRTEKKVGRRIADVTAAFISSLYRREASAEVAIASASSSESVSKSLMSSMLAILQVRPNT